MHSSWYRSSSSLPLITAYLSSRGRYMSKMLVLASWSPPLARRSICSNVISVHPLDVLLQLPDSPVIHRGRALIRQSQRSEEHTSELQSRFALVCRLLLAQDTQKFTSHLQ